MKESDFFYQKSDNLTRAVELIAEDIRNSEAKGEPCVWGMTLADVAVDVYFALKEASPCDVEETYALIGAGFARNLMPSFKVESSDHL